MINQSSHEINPSDEFLLAYYEWLYCQENDLIGDFTILEQKGDYFVIEFQGYNKIDRYRYAEKGQYDLNKKLIKWCKNV